MFKVKFVFATYAAAILMLTCIHTAKSECCFEIAVSAGGGVGFACCSKGSCNFFCCDCTDICQCGKNHKQISSYSSGFNFDEVDKDLDGKVSQSEAIEFLGNHGHNSTLLEQNSKWYTDMDKNGDGFLENNEIGF